MWRDDRNSRHARSLNATTRAEKSSVVLGECSTQNVYSVLPASHENVIPNKCLLNSKMVNPSEISIEFDSNKNSLKIENVENSNLNFELVGSKNLKRKFAIINIETSYKYRNKLYKIEIGNCKMLNQELDRDKDLGLINRQCKSGKNKIKIDNCKSLDLKIYKAKDSGFRDSQYRKSTNKIIKKQKLATIIHRNKNLKEKIKKFISENNLPMIEICKVSLTNIWLNRNLENRVSKFAFVKNLGKSEEQVKNSWPDKNKRNLSPIISKNRKSNRAQEKIVNLNITCAKIQKFRTKKRRNKIKTFTYISYKHESYRKTILKINCFRKINSILGSLKLSLCDAVKIDKGGSNKFTRALSFAMRREDFQLAYHIESLRVRLEKLAHSQAKKRVSLLCLYFNVLFVICFSAITIFRNLRIYRLSEGEATADILCRLREVLHRIKRHINRLVWSVWKHKPHPPHGKNQGRVDRRNYKIGKAPAWRVMCVSEAIALKGNERVIN